MKNGPGKASAALRFAFSDRGRTAGRLRGHFGCIAGHLPQDGRADARARGSIAEVW